MMSLSFYFTASNTLKAAVGVYYITHRLELQNIAFKIHAKLSSGKPKRIHHVRQVCPIFKQILRLSVCVCVCVWTELACLTTRSSGNFSCGQDKETCGSTQAENLTERLPASEGGPFFMKLLNNKVRKVLYRK